MAFKDTQTLTCLLYIWINLIEIITFVALNEGRTHSVGSFKKHAQVMGSFDREDRKAKSGAQIGRLVIGQKRCPNDGDLSSDVSNFDRPCNDKDASRTDDAGWENLQPLWGQVYVQNTLYTPAVEELLGMKPKVDCVGNLMKLTIHGRIASFGSNFLIDRGSISPLPLSQLPSECGHTLLRRWRDFVFVIPYDGCYVSQELNMYILPLLWWGLPIRISCSSSTLAQSSPHVSCYNNGMIVKLQRDAAVNLRVKVLNKWHPLMKASAKCGYSLVSHPEGMVIRAPYMPCTEAKDGMFSLTMALEREFMLSCPALSLSLPIKKSDRPSKNTFISSSLVSSILAPITIASVGTTKPTESQTTSTSSTMQKLFPATLLYHIPGDPYFKPDFPNYIFHPNVPPTVAPQVVVTPLPITQGPQTPVYPKPYDSKPPQTWYPKPNLVPASDPTQSLPMPPRESLLPPIEVLKPSLNRLVSLLRPKSIYLQDKTTPGKPPVTMYPPGKLVYPIYSGKPGLFDTTTVAFGQVPQWLYPSQTRPRPDEPPQLKPSAQCVSPKPKFATPTPAPPRKVESLQLLNFQWYKPFPKQHLDVPTKVIHGTEEFTSDPQPSIHPDYSDTKGPPLSMHFDFTTGTYPTPAPSKNTEAARTSTLTTAPLTQFNLSHALSFHCPTFCPGPPSIAYHYHNHHHFGHPFHVPYMGTSNHAKLTQEMQSSPVQPPGSALFPFIQGMGYNSSPYSSKVEALPPATESPVIMPIRAPESEPLIRPTKCPYVFRTLASNLVSSQSAMKPANIPHFVDPWPTNPLSRPSQNGPIVQPVAHSVQSPTPTYISQLRQHMPTFVAPNRAGPFSKSTTSPADDKSLSNNYWYQAASYTKPHRSDAPAKISKQASVNDDHNSLQSTTPSQSKQTHDVDSSIQLNIHPSMQICDSRNSLQLLCSCCSVKPKNRAFCLLPRWFYEGSIPVCLSHMKRMKQR